MPYATDDSKATPRIVGLEDLQEAQADLERWLAGRHPLAGPPTAAELIRREREGKVVTDLCPDAGRGARPAAGFGQPGVARAGTGAGQGFSPEDEGLRLRVGLPRSSSR